MFQNDRPSPSPQDRRREPRVRVLFTGKLVYLNSSVSADCTIRDISADGARLAPVRGPILDEPFLIVVRAAVAHPSRVAWHISPSVGLNFLETIKLGAETPFELEGIQRLWRSLNRHHEDAQRAWCTVDQPRQRGRL